MMHEHDWQPDPEAGMGWYRCSTCQGRGTRRTSGPLCGQVLESSGKPLRKWPGQGLGAPAGASPSTSWDEAGYMGIPAWWNGKVRR